MRVLTIVGARPQFVKAASVSRALRVNAEEVLLHTGQHYDDAMSAVFFRELGIPPPDLNLHIGGGEFEGQSAGARMGAMVRGIADAIRERSPDVVLIYGDTDSTLAGALAAYEANVSLAHVEAGLRSYNRAMPEEVNRIAADHLSSLLLCPTQGAADTLAREHAAGRVEVVGDVMLDACLSVAESGRASGVTTRLGVSRGGYYAATLHRAENTDDGVRLRAIVLALDSLDLPVILPCHPRTRAALARQSLVPAGSLRLTDPLPYSEMMGLVADARGLCTDSGGLQKEAYFLGVPCVTLRDETEWVETVASGWNQLAGADADRIRNAVRNLAPPGEKPDLKLYGDGKAALAVARLVSEIVR